MLLNRDIISLPNLTVNASIDEVYQIIVNNAVAKYINAGENNTMVEVNYSSNGMKLKAFPEWINQTFSAYHFVGERYVIAIMGWGVILISLGSSEISFTMNFIGPYADIQDSIKYFDERFPRFASEKTVSWMYIGGNGGLAEHHLKLTRNKIYQSYYPSLNKSPEEFFQDYKNSTASVLILIGPTGTGKTNFIKNILYECDFDGFVAYEPKVFAADGFYAKMIAAHGDAAVVLEDADNFLSSRSDGNDLMHSFLNVSDGIISSKGKKMIFSTNLPSIADVDEALMRPGRCFGVLQFDRLTQEQAIRAYQDIFPGEEFTLDGTSFSLAELFNKPVPKITHRVGF